MLIELGITIEFTGRRGRTVFNFIKINDDETVPSALRLNKLLDR